MSAERQIIDSPTDAAMPTRADVLIIGGGPAGAAAAWALYRSDPTLKIVVLERAGQIGAGASNASLENFRTCWPAACLAAMMKRSTEVFLHADEWLGEGAQQALSVKQQGYAFVGITERDAARLRAEVDHLHSVGLTHVEFLDRAAVQTRFPWLGENVSAVKYDPWAGWLDSHALIHRFIRSSPGVRVVVNMPEVQICVENGRVRGVTFAGGQIDAPQVLIASGASARQVGRTAGIELPIVIRPRQSFTTNWRHTDYPSDGPCVIGAPPFAHVRPEAHDGAIFGWEYRWNTAKAHPDEPVSDHLIDPMQAADSYRDPRFPSLVLAVLARQFGHQPGYGFADPRYLRGLHHRAGYYVSRDPATTRLPDGRSYDSQRAIVDSWPGIDGLHLSVAHVGHGIMSSPAAGEIAASKVLGQPLPHPDYSGFALDASYVDQDAGGLGE